MTLLQPGATIGILGGGQLGRMLALEAARFGFDVHIYCPEVDSPAERVAAQTWQAAYDDMELLNAFAEACDVVTYEFENVPVAAVQAIEAAGTAVRPGTKSLEIAQDRFLEKTFLAENGIPPVAFERIDDADTLSEALRRFQNRAILKTRRDGYDGKGQIRLLDPDMAALAAARKMLAEAPCILEAFAPFEREISVVVARTEFGSLTFDVSENEHVGGVLMRAAVPAAIEPDIATRARDAGVRLADALGHIGVLALELFVMPDGGLLANEFAPRVHNSGHWTPDACETGQFEQHVRSVVGWPLGPVTRLFDVSMENLMGAKVLSVPNDLSSADRPVVYGKREALSGRKMGHITRRLGPAS